MLLPDRHNNQNSVMSIQNTVKIVNIVYNMQVT